MTRLITYFFILLGAMMISGCVEEDGKYEKVIPVVWLTNDNGDIEVVNNGNIDVTNKPSTFDLCLFSNGCFKDISVESDDPQCSANAKQFPEPEYTEDGRLWRYSNILRIEMRQEESIKLIINHQETKNLKNIPISVTLFRKENQQ